MTYFTNEVRERMAARLAEVEAMREKVDEVIRECSYDGIDCTDGNDAYGNAFMTGHGKGYRYLASWTGGSDRLLVAYDSERLELKSFTELFAYRDYQLNYWRHRSPLVCLFDDKSSGQRFYFVTMHLARCSSTLRKSQAMGLVEWASD